MSTLPAVPGARAPQVAVVIPCYNVRDHILGVLAGIGPEAAAIYVIDDACPEGTGEHVRKNCADRRVRVIRNERNLGVGGATMRGYREALGEDMDILVKLDGDGQMDPARLASIVRPLVDGNADYAKGNRFFDLDVVTRMPARRLIGNAVLSFVNKMSSGYWDVMDPTNGYTALHANVCRALPLDKIAKDYFFESDMLFRLATLRAVVVDVPMPARYGSERSNLKVGHAARTFPKLYFVRTVKRLFYGYFLRDFNAGTVQFLAGMALLAGGGTFGALRWYASVSSGVPATAGTVILAALPVLIGGHLLIAALNYDIWNVPRRPVHPHLVRRKEADLSATGWVRPG
jgi:glycosyltransferase involved in cell wall biosynthesis